jgi:hypothetical protein
MLPLRSWSCSQFFPSYGSQMVTPNQHVVISVWEVEHINHNTQGDGSQTVTPNQHVVISVWEVEHINHNTQGAPLSSLGSLHRNLKTCLVTRI